MDWDTGYLTPFLGLLAAPITSLLTTSVMRSEYKVLISVFVSFFIGIIVVGFTTKSFTALSLIESSAMVFMASTWFYKTYFEKSVLHKLLVDTPDLPSFLSKEPEQKQSTTSVDNYQRANAYTYEVVEYNEVPKTNEVEVHNPDDSPNLRKIKQFK